MPPRKIRKGKGAQLAEEDPPKPRGPLPPGTGSTMQRRLSRRESFEEEGVLYTVRVAERPILPKQSTREKWRTFAASYNPKKLFAFPSRIKTTKEANGDTNPNNSSDSENGEAEGHDQFNEGLPQATRGLGHTRGEPLARSLIGELKLTPSVRRLSVDFTEDDEDSMHSNNSSGPLPERQYTISKRNKKPYGVMTYPVSLICNLLGLHIGKELQMYQNTETHLYKPSKRLYRYICWTFYSSFLEVFFSFFVIFLVLSVIFACFLLLAGDRAPECIMVSGEEFGAHSDTRFYDAFALSWATFTTVGYGNIYTATGVDFESISHSRCSSVVFLCTLEAFVGLLYAGMCAAILFGKVNRVQCHANVEFCNAVCLLYLGQDDTHLNNDQSDSEEEVMSPIIEDEDEIKCPSPNLLRPNMPRPNLLNAHKRMVNQDVSTVRCPVLKFQVVNEYCNKEGGDIVDAYMKVVGIKMKTLNGKITHSQIVRANLVDSEHPFFSRIWHGVHVLDETSQLLTQDARKKIKNNGGVWPKHWFFDTEKIRKKLDFHSLIVTVSGTSNLSACTVHASKLYSSGDLLVGFDFAPLVFFNEEKNSLEVDMSLVHDVKEQRDGTGENPLRSSAKRDSTILKQSFKSN